MRLDSTYTVNTPEGIALELSPAGPVPRTLAWTIDLAIRGAISLFLFLILAFMGRMGTGIALILVFLLEWFYPVWFELRHEGQTPGKKLLQIYVAQLDASPVSPAASVIRNLLRGGGLSAFHVWLRPVLHPAEPPVPAPG
ncbi:MAG: RDD family protein [Thiolinea sp.]